MAQEIPVALYNQAQETKKINSMWWNETEKVHEHIFGLVDHIDKKQIYHQALNIRNGRLYSNMDLIGATRGIQNNNIAAAAYPNRITLNIVKSCADTVTSKIAKSKPRPLFLTEGGDWKLKKKAQQLTKYIQGAFEQMDLYTKAPMSFLDSAVFGTGDAKFFINRQAKRIDCDRVIPDELTMDDYDAYYGSPKSLFHCRMYSKSALIAMFPKSENIIMAATPDTKISNATPLAYDLIKVIEAYHLPSSKDAKDGKKAIVISNATLDVSDWEADDFGMAFLRWNPKLTGFWGFGLAEELTGIQLEINKLLRTIQAAQHLMAVPRIYIENNSMINTAHITNEIASIIKYTGTPPTFGVAPAMPPEVYAHLETLIKRAYEITGVSMLSAAARKPAGIDSGVALREYQDIESERFQLTSMRYEQFFCDSAKIVIRLTKKLAEQMKQDGEELSIKVGAGKHAETIKWSDVDMDEDQYVMKVFPTSMLPTTPAGKLQAVQELLQAGLIPKEMAVDLLDFPDLEAAMDRVNGNYRLVEKLIEQMIEHTKYEPPEPYMNCAAAKDQVQLAYMKAKLDSVPEKNLELLRRFMDDCQTALGVAKAGDQALMMQQQAQNQIAVPQGRPQSDLVPFKQGGDGQPQGAAPSDQPMPAPQA